MKIFRVSYDEYEVYANVEFIQVVANQHLGSFSTLKKAESFIDKHYCKRYPGHEYDNHKGAAKPGDILKKKRKVADGYEYNTGLSGYKITIEDIK